MHSSTAVVDARFIDAMQGEHNRDYIVVKFPGFDVCGGGIFMRLLDI